MKIQQYDLLNLEQEEGSAEFGKNMLSENLKII